MQACRPAKEALLGRSRRRRVVPVTVMGQGRPVIGGTLSANLTADDVASAIFDGFFPPRPSTPSRRRGARAGLHEMGLPYVSDPADQRHLAAFLRRHLHDFEGEIPEASTTVDAILFNGGVFQPAVLRDRVVEVMRPWFDTPEAVAAAGADQPVARPGRGVGRGVLRLAAAHRRQAHRRRHPAVVLRRASRQTRPAAASTRTRSRCCASCRSTWRRARRSHLPKPELELALGQPVLFPLYTSTVRGDDKPGEVLRLARASCCNCRRCTRSCAAASGPARSTCRSRSRPGVPRSARWNCTASRRKGTAGGWSSTSATCFANRRAMNEDETEAIGRRDRRVARGAGAGRRRADRGSLWRTGDVGRRIHACHHPELPKLLEAALEAPRRLADRPVPAAVGLPRGRTAARGRSPGHLAALVQPGRLLPAARLRRPARPVPRRAALEADHRRGQHADRRPGKKPTVSGGRGRLLDHVAARGRRAEHRARNRRCSPAAAGAAAGQGQGVSRPPANELAEMWRAAASLERLDAKNKEALGEALLSAAKKPGADLRLLGADAARARACCSTARSTRSSTRRSSSSGSKSCCRSRPATTASGTAGCSACRNWPGRAGCGAVDVSDITRNRVLGVLRTNPCPPAWKRMVEEVVAAEGEEASRLFGESLPIGLRLSGSA